MKILNRKPEIGYKLRLVYRNVASCLHEYIRLGLRKEQMDKLVNLLWCWSKWYSSQTCVKWRLTILLTEWNINFLFLKILLTFTNHLRLSFNYTNLTGGEILFCPLFWHDQLYKKRQYLFCKSNIDIYFHLYKPWRRSIISANV